MKKHGRHSRHVRAPDQPTDHGIGLEADRTERRTSAQ